MIQCNRCYLQYIGETKPGPAEHGELGGCSPPPPPTFLQSNENESLKLFVSLKKALNQPPHSKFLSAGSVNAPSKSDLMSIDA